MAQQVIALAVLAKDLGSVLSNHIKRVTLKSTSFNSSFQGLQHPLLVSVSTRNVHIHTHTDIHTHIYENKFSKNQKGRRKEG